MQLNVATTAPNGPAIFKPVKLEALIANGPGVI